VLLPGAALAAALAVLVYTWPGYSAAGVALLHAGAEAATLCVALAAALDVNPADAALLIAPSLVAVGVLGVVVGA